jgi:hypothetical protein
MESFISICLLIFGIYLLIGILFSIAFLWKGITKVDPGTADSGFFFKLLLFPGISFFWILFLSKWLKSNRS